MTCPTSQEMVDERINRVLTQYRESPNLLFLLRTYLGKLSETALQVCDLPEKFDIDSAVGDQLTIIGKRLGWPREHCVCDVQPVFGFDCEEFTDLHPVSGFCDDQVTWLGCGSVGTGTLYISSDEVYRKFLKVRRYQMVGLFDLNSLETSIQIFFGEAARILHSGQGRVVIAPGRDLTNSEAALLQLYPRVLPTALGIEVRFHFGDLDVFGFGDGWGGFCNPALPTDESYQRTGKLFGFCGDTWTDDDIGGFCESWSTVPRPIETGNGFNLITQDEGTILMANDVDLVTGDDSSWLCRPGANWMCEFDVKPYSC